MYFRFVLVLVIVTMAELEGLKKQRSAAKRRLTRTTNYLESLLGQGNQIRLADLTGNIELFHERVRAYSELQSAVELILTDEEFSDDLKVSEDYLEGCRQVLWKAQECSAEMTQKVPSESTSARWSSVKLPKIPLTQYSGDILKWQSFWQLFNASVGSKDITDREKFTYLLSSLKGEALHVVDGLELCDENYKPACDLLVERFGRKEGIIFAHIQGLMSLHMQGHEHRAPTGVLRKLQEDLVSHVRSLESLGVTGTGYGVILVPMILSRLPSDVRLEWTRTGRGKESDLQYLLEFLKGEIDRRETADSFRTLTLSSQNSSSSKETRFHQKQHNHSKTRVPTASALTVNTRSSESKSKCVFCKKSHSSWKCFKAPTMDLQAKWDLVNEKKLCYCCLEPGHNSVYCSYRCEKCGKKHHKFLCRPIRDNRPTRDSRPSSDHASQQSTGTSSASSETAIVNLSHCKTKCRVFQTAKCEVVGSKGKFVANVLLDSGSDHTYIKQSIVEKIGCKFETSCEITYAPFGGGKNTKTRNVFSVRTKSRFCNDSVELQAISVPTISVPIVKQTLPSDVLEKVKYLKLADDVTCTEQLDVDILVGLDYYWHVIKPESVLKIGDAIVAQESVYGYVLSGSWDARHPSSEGVNHAFTAHTLFLMTGRMDVSDNMLRNFWDLESLGIADRNDDDVLDSAVLAEFNRTIDFNSHEGKYMVRIPWKCNSDELTDNFALAKARCDRLERSLDENLTERYNVALDEMHKLDFIEEIDVKHEQNDRIFYLPHRPVVKESSSSTKVRPVFDGSAKGPNGISLNDTINAGPNLLPNLMNVLMRFRRWRYALSADITKAFLQVMLSPSDRDVHRFLWQGKVYRFKRVTFGINCSPFLLNATIKFHLENSNDCLARQELQENLYVDDLLSGSDTQQGLLQLYEDAHSIMDRAGMTLTKWKSNHSLFSDQLENAGSKVLGICWSPEEDLFHFKAVEFPDNMIGTKRLVLSCISRLYDPLGFVAPFSMSLKILFQAIWKLGLDWDEPLPLDMQSKFVSWLEGLHVLRSFTVQRSYFLDGWNCHVDKLELHVFCDASELGYGCIVYLKHGSNVALVCSKAKVAPVKKVTLPRLELLGCLIGARMMQRVKVALKLPPDVSVKCWTDSTVALGWIHGDPGRWKQFVRNRVEEIQTLVSPCCWSHCPGVDNPADLLTRGLSASSLVESDLWLHGPCWLSDDSSCDPPQSDFVDEPPSDECVTLVAVVPQSMNSVLPFDRWSSFSKTVRIVGWVYRFSSNCRSAERKSGDLTYDEMYKAKIAVFREVQKECYATDFERLKSGSDVSRNSPIFNLRPCLDENGLLRMGSRLQMSELSFEERHPIILPKGHVAQIMVREKHVSLCHAGVASIVTSMRDSFWIVGLRPIAKGVVKHCVICRRLESKPCGAIAAPLPADRVQPACPFVVTGVDFAGPLYAIDCPGQKFYICLFTCMTVRAVHLELVPSLTTTDFLMCFRRFTARRGMPTCIWSDNGRTFVSAKDALLRAHGPTFEWKFIVPRSPWWGGVWERQVRTVKSCLRKCLGLKVATVDELSTILCDVEATVNSRPLTYTGDDSPQSLSPAHFLLNRRNNCQPNVQVPINDRETLLGKEKSRLDLLNRFWEVWRLEYLRNLPVTVTKFANRNSLKVGDVVVINEDNVRRMSWPMAKVLKLYPSKDGIP